ncbi:MAG: hypothetical protein ACI8RA_002203, partial [Chlamydiales bacterium]
CLIAKTAKAKSRKVKLCLSYLFLKYWRGATTVAIRSYP